MENDVIAIAEQVASATAAGLNAATEAEKTLLGMIEFKEAWAQKFGYQLEEMRTEGVKKYSNMDVEKLIASAVARWYSVDGLDVPASRITEAVDALQIGPKRDLIATLQGHQAMPLGFAGPPEPRAVRKDAVLDSISVKTDDADAIADEYDVLADQELFVMTDEGMVAYDEDLHEDASVVYDANGIAYDVMDDAEEYDVVDDEGNVRTMSAEEFAQAVENDEIDFDNDDTDDEDEEIL